MSAWEKNRNDLIKAAQEASGHLMESYMGFKGLTKKLAAKKGKKKIRNPKALAAVIGRAKYGKKKFQSAASKHKKLG